MVGEMLDALGTERLERNVALGDFAVEDDGHAAVDFLLFGHQGAACGDGSGGDNKLATRLVDGLVGDGTAGSELIFDGVLLAVFDAVETCDATAHVDVMLFGIDALRLAIAGALGAAVALASVDDGAEERELGEESKHGSDGADGVAPESTPEEGHEGDNDEGDKGHNEHEGCSHATIDLIEGVAAMILGDGGTKIVDPIVDGRKQMGGDAAIGAIGRNDYCNGVETCDHQNYEKSQHAPTNPAGVLGVVETIFLEPSAHVGEAILHDAHGAYHGAIDTTEQQCEQQHG